jgi:hypothetical protein
VKTHFITVDNAWPALKEKGMAGTLPPAEAFPLQSFASDLHYTILPNGVLTSIFTAASPSEIGFSRILEGLPPCSGLQLYSHHHPDTGDRKFLALSALVDYRCPFSPLQGLGSMLTGGAISRELEKLELATRETYAVLVRCAQSDSASLQLLGNPTPLLQVLGPLRLCEASLEAAGAITYNLSYLLLGAARLAILIEFNSFPASGEHMLPHPSGDLEYLSATCIHQPAKEDLARLDSEVQEYLTFLRYFRKPGEIHDAAQPTIPTFATQAGVTLKGRALAKHYVLLFGSTLTDLRLKAQDYFRDLCRAGISFHASMIRTRESYSHLYPGNFRLLNDGLRMEAVQVPGILRRLHP